MRLATLALAFMRLAIGVLALALALSTLLGRHIAVLPGCLAGPLSGGRGLVAVLAGSRVLGRRAIGLGGLTIGFPLLRLILPLGLGAGILLVRLAIRGVF